MTYNNAVTLPGDCHATLAMTEYFVRNVKRVCLLKSNRKLYTLSLYYSVQRTLCHSEELRCNDVRISRKGHLIKITKTYVRFQSFAARGKLNKRMCRSPEHLRRAGVTVGFLFRMRRKFTIRLLQKRRRERRKRF